MNEVINNIVTRRSIRKFTAQPVPKEVMADIVDAALHAPSGMGKQSWKFTVVTNREMITKLAEAVEKATNREGYDMYEPTAIIIPSNLKDSPWGRDDNACALENIFLAANSYGVGSVWINQLSGICDEPAIRNVLDELGIPADHVIYGLAALGYADNSEPVKEKQCIGEVAYVE